MLQLATALIVPAVPVAGAFVAGVPVAEVPLAASGTVPTLPATRLLLPEVNKLTACEVGTTNVLSPTTRVPPLCNDTGVPDTIMPNPPAETVCPATTEAVGFAVKVWPPTVKSAMTPIQNSG